MGDNPSASQTEGGLPVERVSYDDAVGFCEKLQALDGKPYRLPTEAEWEYACRAGTSSRFNAGDDKESLAAAGWFIENSDSHTHPVGQKQPNRWWLYDMHGNVRQWCSDLYGAFGNVDETDPTGANVGDAHVLRGGSWRDYSKDCRSASRAEAEANSQENNVGFRVVLNVDPALTPPN